MSPFFRQSNIGKFTPKTIKFSQLYAHNIGTLAGIDNSVKDKARNALSQAGISSDEISQIISHDRPLSVSQMKAVAGLMNRFGVYGFEKNQDSAIKNYLNKERIKAQSIAGIRKEHILEALEEDISSESNVSLSGRDKSPNKPKVKEQSKAVFSLNRVKSSKPTSSLRTNAGSSTVAGNNRSFLKPKF